MDPAPQPPPGAVATWGTEPLVVAARVDGREDAVAVLDRLRAELPGTSFIAVVAVADLGELGGLSPAADVHWDGTALLVPGPSEVLEQARSALAAGIPPASP
jgi:hypothetical protein